MKQYIKLIIAGGILALVLLFAATAVSVSAGTSFFVQSKTGYEAFSFLSATTTNATSTNLTGGGGYFIIAGAKNVALYFSRGGATNPNTGSTRFSIQVTPDGSSWYDYNTLVQNVASTTYPATLANVTISAATSTVITYLRDVSFYAIRCIVVETTDGEHTCSAGAQF